MGYVTVTGGKEAIYQAEQLVDYYRLKDSSGEFSHTMIYKHLRLLVDRVMSEGELYAPEYAALAVKQAEGDPYEAIFLMRSYRSTLVRSHYTLTLKTEDMRIIRRISSAFRDIPGGQILGPTRDYTHRMLRFSLRKENIDDISAFLKEFRSLPPLQDKTSPFIKVIDQMRQDGLVPAPQNQDVIEPFDITRQNIRLPAPRSARLQALTRSDAGMLSSLAYSYTRGFGANTHPTIAELRVGYVPVFIPHPYDNEISIYVGEMLLTEVETINTINSEKNSNQPLFSIGYGLCFGHNEQKAIAMSIIEHCLETPGTAPAEDEEFVLMHSDALDAGGIIFHFNLPHYVTFNATLERLEQLREQNKNTETEDPEIANYKTEV